MSNIKNTISLAAVICGLLICFGAPTELAAQKPPDGSYQKSCSQFSVSGNNLSAMCKRKSGQGIATFDIVVPTILTDFNLCNGDISNQNGSLSCKKLSDAELKDAIAFSKKLDSIDKAFQHVYGRKAQSYERKNWIAATGKYKNSDYENVVSVETANLNSELQYRGYMLTDAFKVSFGRPPGSIDFNYWRPRKETFADTVKLLKTYLYSPDGAKELDATIRRYLKDATGNQQPSDNQVEEILKKSVKDKRNYSEMYPDLRIGNYSFDSKTGIVKVRFMGCNVPKEIASFVSVGIFAGITTDTGRILYDSQQVKFLPGESYPEVSFDVSKISNGNDIVGRKLIRIETDSGGHHKEENEENNSEKFYTHNDGKFPASCIWK